MIFKIVQWNGKVFLYNTLDDLFKENFDKNCRENIEKAYGLEDKEDRKDYSSCDTDFDIYGCFEEVVDKRIDSESLNKYQLTVWLKNLYRYIKTGKKPILDEDGDFKS